jgi:hypothetical protein
LEINFYTAAIKKLSVSQIVAICEICGCELATLLENKKLKKINLAI